MGSEPLRSRAMTTPTADPFRPHDDRLRFRNVYLWADVAAQTACVGLGLEKFAARENRQPLLDGHRAGFFEDRLGSRMGVEGHPDRIGVAAVVSFTPAFPPWQANVAHEDAPDRFDGIAFRVTTCRGRRRRRR